MDKLNSYMTMYTAINLSLVAFIAMLYSAVELLQRFKDTGTVFCNVWAWIYLLLNGAVAILALVLTFQHEISQQFLWGKLVLAGTSGLALLRVISINQSKDGVEANPIPIVEVIKSHLITSIDRTKYAIDISKIKKINSFSRITKVALHFADKVKKRGVFA